MSADNAPGKIQGHFLNHYQLFSLLCILLMILRLKQYDNCPFQCCFLI